MGDDERSGEVTQVLQRIAAGSATAADELLPLVYQELRTLARARMARERPGHTLEPTGLVHEAYLRLLEGTNPSFNDRAHFFAAAARAMQRILVERARRYAAVKHGGGKRRVTLDGERAAMAADYRADDVLAVDQALRRLEALDAKMAELVRLRFFAGMKMDEVAALLDRPLRSVERMWTAARAWLQRELSQGAAP